ncbi:MAG TPA: YihY/virulence factor BrkB family protein [Fibrobacteria bacterium]|nr:YihY/virulence factor BrkB family protein [Fibrobacteria bacterium]
MKTDPYGRPPRTWRTHRRELYVLAKSHATAWIQLGDTGAFSQAAAISYYTILSIFPFLLFLVVVSTRLLEDPELSVSAIRLLGSYMPNGRQFLMDTLPVLQKLSGTLGVVSVAGLAWSSMGLFAALRTGLDQVAGERTPPSSLLHRWASFIAVMASSIGLLVCLALATLLSFVARLSVQFLAVGMEQLGQQSGELSALLMRPAGLALQSGTLALSQLITWVGILALLNNLPRTRPGIHNSMVPALWVTLALDQLKGWFLVFVGTNDDFTVVHGPLAAAIAFMLWAYLSALVFLYGGAWATHLRKERMREARIRQIPERP